MQASKSPKSAKPRAATTGTKFLIAAASLTAVVGGWAAFSLKEPAPATPEASTLVLPPLPTLMARPGIMTQTASESSVSGNQPDVPALRSVTIPQASANAAPPPVTHTRSSR